MEFVMEFKEGDRVRFRDTSFQFHRRKHSGVVKSMCPPFSATVLWDGYQFTETLSPDEVELVSK